MDPKAGVLCSVVRNLMMRGVLVAKHETRQKHSPGLPSTCRNSLQVWHAAGFSCIAGSFASGKTVACQKGRTEQRF